MSISIFERDEIAKSKYKSFMEKYNCEDMKETNLEKYHDIMELLLLNNTDKDIVKLYLNFLKHNKNFIESNELNAYDEEIMKYKILFSVAEIEEIDKQIKKKSEKENLINFLKRLSGTKKNEEFISYIKNEYNKIYYFNYPIEFFQDELFYYKFYILIISELYKHREDDAKYFDERSKVAEFVLKNEIFQNTDIINNEDKMNILIIAQIKAKIQKLRKIMRKIKRMRNMKIIYYLKKKKNMKRKKNLKRKKKY